MKKASTLSPQMEIGLRVLKMNMANTLTEDAFLQALDDYMKVYTSEDALETFLQNGKPEWVASYFKAEQKRRAATA